MKIEERSFGSPGIHTTHDLLIGILPNDANPEEVGIKLSTTDTISVSKTKSSNTFVIYYRLFEFKKLNPKTFLKSLSDILHKNMPGDIFMTEIRGYVGISNTIYGINDIARMLNINGFVNGSLPNVIIKPINIVKSEYGGFMVEPDDDDFKLGNSNLGKSHRRLSNQLMDDDDYDELYDEYEDDYDEDDYDYDDDEDDEDDDIQYRGDRRSGSIHDILSNNDYGGYDYDDTFIGNDRRYKNNKKKTYQSSRIIKSSNHAKRDIKRHGILIESGKARDKDADTIKAFLKDFIPGKSNWAKSYRKLLLKRWMNQYAITKKTAKKIEREHLKSQNGNNKNKFKSTNISKTTRGLLKHYNAFYDTSK